jgi:phytoene dehydrogenase-like protein
MASASLRDGPDAAVVGAGPNGLAAAIVLARAGRSVVVHEACETPGGGMRTAELTLPGFRHDVCSTAHPLAVGSSFFRSVSLQRHGLDFVHPAAPMAHPFDDGDALLLHRSVDDTAAQMSTHDARAYRGLFAPLAEHADQLLRDVAGPVRLPLHPFVDARFGLSALRSGRGLAASTFDDDRPRAFFSGLAAHSIMPLHKPATASFGLVLGMLGHAVGWPFARGGSHAITEALIAELRSLGGDVVTSHEVTDVDDLHARAALLDVTPRQVLRIAGDRLPPRYRRGLQRFRYGAGVFKLDWALDGPIPWRDPRCLQAGTVHIGGGFDDIVGAEAAVGRGEHPERPFVLLTQPTVCDPSRAPAGRHIGWAYCHVPNGSTVDMTERIEKQVERFAPGFRDRILARSVMTPADIERHDANHIGGDINGGVQDLRQLFTRPVVRINPYATPDRGIYICSSSTPPGGGVHGLCGMFAAETALRRAWR